MRDIQIDQNTKINPIGRERIYTGSDEICILILHGFTGNTGEMDFLGKSIYNQTGYSVYIPRLPGHGTTSQDFQQSNAQNWLRKTYDSYLKMKASYEKVYVIGLSMGGLLAILTSARFKIEKLVLIAAALYAKNPLVPFTHGLKYFLKSIKADSDLESKQFQSKEERLHHEHYYQYHYPAQIAELHKLMLLTRKRLSYVESSTLILASKGDEVVPLKAAYQLQKQISSKNKELYIFPDSPHVINNGPDKEKCAAKIISFLQSNS